jgi:hypothetical protein
MSEAPSNTPQSKRPALPWLVLAVFALGLAVAMDAFMGWGIQFFSISGVPSVFQLVFSLRKFLYAFPIAFGAAAMAAGHRRILTEPWVLVTASVALAAVHLVLCYGVMLAGVAISGGFTPRRLPPEVRTMLTESERSEVLSLWPRAATKREKPSLPIVGEFHGYPLLGRVAVENPLMHQQLIKAVLTSIDGSDGSKALCFMPRHAIRIKRGADELDLLICYQCRYITLHRGSEQWEVGVSEGSKAFLNQLLTDAGIPLAPAEGGVVVVKPASAN